MAEGISLTEKAEAEVRRVMAEQKLSREEYVLETGVIGGGCSGLTYKLCFKERSAIDPSRETVLGKEHFDVAVGNRSLLYLDGAVIDFHEGLTKRGFSFSNPMGTGSCACGSSFRP